MSSNTLSQSYSFSPANVVSSGCRLWLDAADATTFTYSSGSNLSQWRDKSGSNNHATATVGPVYSPSSNSVYFVGNVNSYMNLPNGTLPSGNSPYFIIAVTTPLSGGFHLIGSGTPAANQTLSPGWNLPTDLFDAWYSNDLNVTTAITFTNRQSMLEFNYNQSTRTIFVEGTSVGSGAATNRNSSSLSNVLAAYLSAGTPYTPMFLNEMIVYSNVITTTQRQQVEGYLAWKWNLVTNLPSNHPFKTTPPFANNPSLPPSLYPSGPIRFGASSSPFSFFNPTSITGCSLWLDAADPSSFVLSGSNVTTWNDKSGNANTATSVGNNAAVLSGSSVVFTGSNGVSSTRFTIPDTPSLRFTSPFTMYMVYSATALAPTVGNNYGSMMLISKFADGGSYPGWAYRARGYNSSNIIYTAEFFNSAANQGDVTVTSVNVVDGTPKIVGLNQRTSNTLNTFVNGSADLTITPMGLPVTSTDILTIGARNATNPTTNPMNGSVNEILIYSASFSLAQCQQLEGYLAWKWGLQGNLPSNHPYKNAPPGLPVPAVPLTRQLGTRFWSPTSVSGCSLWLDGFDPNGTGVLPANNASLSTWVDKSSFRNNGTASGTTGIFQTGSFNTNYPSVFFNVSKYGGTYPTNTGTTVTGFYVGRASASAGNFSRFISLSRPGVNDFDQSSVTPMLTVSSDGNKTFRSERSGSVAVNYTTSSVANVIANVLFDGTNCLFYANGSLVTTTASSGSFNLTQYGIGAGTQDTGQLIGNVAEIILFNSSVSASERQQIEGYLAWKWGLVGSLPGTHPYKLFPPAPA